MKKFQKPWTDKEVQYLKDHTDRSIGQLARELGRTYSAVKNKLKRDGIENISNGRQYIPTGVSWSEEEILFLRDHCVSMSFKEMAGVLGRSESSVRNKIVKSGMLDIPKNRTYWSGEEERFLEETYAMKGAEYVAKKLGRTVSSVRHKAQRMNIPSIETDALDLRTVANAFQSDISVVKRWMEKYGMPYTLLDYTKKRRNNRIYRIDAEKFWDWAEKHKDVINWSKYKAGYILPEPTWAIYAKIESKAAVNSRKSFRPSEIRRIKKLKERGVPTKRIAEMYGRSIESIKHVYRMPQS